MKIRGAAVTQSFVLAAFIWISLSVSAAAQNAVVTFYSHGSELTTGLPGAKHGIFYGDIYDGQEWLFTFSNSFVVKNDHFLILSLAPGSHTFYATYGKYPKKSEAVSIMLEAGKNYFIRAQSVSSGIGIVEFEKGHLDEVACGVPQHEMGKAKPLTESSVSEKWVGSMVSPQLIPSCP